MVSRMALGNSWYALGRCQQILGPAQKYIEGKQRTKPAPKLTWETAECAAEAFWTFTRRTMLHVAPARAPPRAQGRAVLEGPCRLLLRLVLLLKSMLY